MSAIQSHNKPPVMVFVASTIVIFFMSLSAADSIGFVPDYIDGSAPVATETASQTDTSQEVALADLPELGDAQSAPEAAVVTSTPARIQIPAIDLDLAIQNPATTDVDELDALLVNGPARYGDSAKLGEDGTMIIFAHSSHLPIVHNAMYKAFNRIPELKANDTITLVGKDGKSYLYQVESVVKADATDAKIEVSKDLGTRLVLVTCDTLTGKSARYVLTATFVGSVSE